MMVLSPDRMPPPLTFCMATAAPAGDESRPQDTNLVGTPHCMSPEVLSCKPYGYKTDVW